MQIATLSALLHHFLPAGRAAAACAIAPVARSLQQGATMVVPDARGVQVTCLAGSLWITHDGDPKDVVLPAGASYSSARRARMVVYAFEPASVLVH